MYYGISPAIMLTEFVNLGVTVMAAGDAVVGSRGLNLPVFQPSILKTLFLESGLKKAATAATAIIVGSIGLHVDKIFFSHNRLDHKAEVFRYGIAIAFSNDLAGVLHRKLDFQAFIPVRVDF